ncbi:MAG: hypothetical protein BGN86_08730 [Caulobacterales bacterium 68-7]|mgnify:CR=1 FL=1|nr:MAG: hypothetical protein BGN86_08730 [Caulobacterales bacterium 68-7]
MGAVGGSRGLIAPSQAVAADYAPRKRFQSFRGNTMNSLNRLAVRGALVCALLAPAAAFAQGAPAAAPAAPPAPAPLVVPNPVYDTIELEQMVNKPAKEVWAKVGKFCDIEAWFGLKCVITAGQEGKLGAVRTLNGTTIEPIVSMTELSYVYTQPVRQGVTPNLYHGSLEARPVGANQTKLVYQMFYDVSMLDAAGRAAAKANRVTRFTAGLQKMKEIAEK